MRLLKLLLSSSIIYIATLAIEDPTDKESDIVQCKALNYNLLNNVYPLHYNIKLNFTDYYLENEYEITIYITYATQHINFHLSNSIIKSIFIRSKLNQAHNNRSYKPALTETSYKTNIVLYHFNDILLPGIYNLYIQFEIAINVVRESFGIPYINENGDKEFLIITGIPTRKQQLFPIWYNPKLSIAFDISIKHHRSYKALSNTPIRESSELLHDEIWTYFNKTVVNFDNIAFVMFNFHRINLTNTISMWCRPQLTSYIKFASYIIKSITMYLRNYWNNSKRFLEWTIVLSESKVDHIAIPNLQDEVKDILGFVFHRETDIMYNEELDTVARKIIIASSVVRRMIQKYVGNLFDPFYWFHVWLNEGFFVYFQTYIIHETVPDFRMMDLFIVQIQHELLDLNTYVDLSFPKDVTGNYLYTFLSRGKGFIIWRMLERIFSRSIFSEAINKYFNNQHAKPLETTSDNLWNIMQTVVDELDYKYQFNVKSMVHSWVMQKCFPILEVTRNYSNNIVTISAQFHNKLDEKQYYIPISYTTESESNFIITWANIWLTPSKSKIEFEFVEKDQWIILNLQQAGYYRVNYDTENWRKIAQYLNSEEYKNIHVLNRAQIIDDAFHFAKEKKLEISVFWKLVNYLQKEEDYIAWYPMIKAFEFISNIVAFFEFYPEFKEVQKPLDLKWDCFLLNKYSYDNHVEFLKQEVAKWKCLMNNYTCKRTAYEQLEWNLNNPIIYKLSPGWKRWTYCNGLKLSNYSTWNRSFNFSVKKIDYTILECLAYSESFQITVNYLEEKLPASFETFRHIFMTSLLSSDILKSIKRTETLIANIFLSALARNTKYMLKDLSNNFRKFTYYYRTVNKMVILTVIINNVYSKAQLGLINEFIRNMIRESQYNFEVLDVVERKIEIRRSEIQRQTEFLQSLFTK